MPWQIREVVLVDQVVVVLGRLLELALLGVEEVGCK